MLFALPLQNPWTDHFFFFYFLAVQACSGAAATKHALPHPASTQEVVLPCIRKGQDTGYHCLPAAVYQKGKVPAETCPMAEVLQRMSRVDLMSD